MNAPRVTPTDIPGLLVLDLHRVEDSRGWMQEAWQREKMTAAGLPDFGPVQNNVSVNATAGVTRGFHAEPWDKLISVATGRIFGAWVDLREGPSFGRIVSLEVEPGRGVFVPRGVGNAYQALEDGTCYTTLINEHWSEEARESATFTNLDHPSVEWPIPLSDAVLSDADQAHPALDDVEPAQRPRPLIIGADGEFGTALREELRDAQFADHDDLDVTDPDAVAALDFRNISAIINAAGLAGVDGAKADARAEAWSVNVTGTANLVAAARDHRIPLVHLSSSRVFGDGELHDEDEAVSPGDPEGAVQAAADAVVATWQHHYILRADRASVEDLSGAIVHVLTGPVPYGIYNVSSEAGARLDKLRDTGFEPRADAT